MSDDYAPFPEKGLLKLAKFCEFAHERGGFSWWKEYGQTCRDAIANYKALNERCLRAELERDHGIKP